MYLGFLLILCGRAILLRNALVFPFLPMFILYMSRFQIQPEERALTETFGAMFTGYTARVRRWIKEGVKQKDPGLLGENGAVQTRIAPTSGCRVLGSLVNVSGGGDKGCRPFPRTPFSASSILLRCASDASDGFS